MSNLSSTIWDSEQHWFTTIIKEPGNDFKI